MAMDLVYPKVPEDIPDCPQDYVDYLRQGLMTAHAFAREHLSKAAIRQKRNYDKHTAEREPFQEDDLVRYYYPPLRQQSKFALPWTGPWRIVEQTSAVDYRIELVSNPKKKRVVHYDTLKPFEGTGRFTEDNSASDKDIPLISPTDGEDIVKDKTLDSMADLFMPQSAYLSDVPNAFQDVPGDGYTSSDSDTDLPRPRAPRRHLRPRSRLKAPSKYSPA